jgi:hypothetical protein
MQSTPELMPDIEAMDLTNGHTTDSPEAPPAFDQAHLDEIKSQRLVPTEREIAFRIMNLKYSFWTTRERAFVFTKMFQEDLREQFSFMDSDDTYMAEWDIAELIAEPLAEEWTGYELSWEDYWTEMCAWEDTEAEFLDEERLVERCAVELDVNLTIVEADEEADPRYVQNRVWDTPL